MHKNLALIYGICDPCFDTFFSETKSQIKASSDELRKMQ